MPKCSFAVLRSETDVPRGDTRRQRTRAALIKAAQTLITEGRTAVAISEIARIADVGLGSFNNHFSSKDELFAAAVAGALQTHGALIDELTCDLDDPAKAFAQRFRMTARLLQLSPELSGVLLAHGWDSVSGPAQIRPPQSRTSHRPAPHTCLA